MASQSAPPGAAAYDDDMPLAGSSSTKAPTQADLQKLALGQWTPMSEEDRINAKTQLYLAGFYGNQKPVLWSQLDDTDIAAMQSAMGIGSINNSDWQTVTEARAQQAQQAGVPFTSIGDAGMQGTYDAAVTDLRQFALSNGINLPEDYIAKTAKAIENGDTTPDSVYGDLRDNYVATAYPAFADRIKAGQNLSEIAAPYLGEMESMLELPSGSVSLQDRTLQRALQATDKDGNPAMVPIWQFKDALKKDDRYQYTEQAFQDVGSMAASVLSGMGLG